MDVRQIRAMACAIAVGGVLGTSCESDETTCSDTITTKTDPSGDFAHYTTFAVTPPDAYPKTLPSDVLTALTQADAAAAAELQNHGLTQVNPSDNPNVTVFSLARTTDQTALYWQCYGGYWYGYWSYYWDPCAWLTPAAVDYTVATLIVGLADPAQSKVVFGGAAQGVLECNDETNRIAHDVQSIFAAYPHAGATP